MTIHRVVWGCAVVATVAIGLAGTLLAVPLEAVVAVGLMLVVFGALMGYAFKDELPRVRHPILIGAALFTGPGLYPGLAELLGPAAVGLVALLAVLSPPVVSLTVRRLRGRLLPSETECAAMAPPEQALRLQWVESTRQLERAATLDEQLLVVQAREQILDDLVERSNGVLPDYVWRPASRDGGPDLSPHGSSDGDAP